MNRVEELLGRGVRIVTPTAVEIGAEVNPDRIAPGVVIHTGCKVFGASTGIGPGCVLGREAPATVEDCQLGEKVELKGAISTGRCFWMAPPWAAELRFARVPSWKKVPKWRTRWV